jgi:hypothetical protein
MQESGMPKDTQEIGLELQAQENDQGLLPGIIHDESPFTKGFRVKTKGRKVSVGGDDLAVMNLQTGELNGTAEITQTIAVDKEKFVKVFQMQIGAFFGLTSAGAKVLTAIWKEMSREPGKDIIYMSESAAKRHAKTVGSSISKATYFRGRANLIENGFIAPSADQNRYWINPALFFNGDRVKFITEMKKADEIAGPGEKFENEE